MKKAIKIILILIIVLSVIIILTPIIFKGKIIEKTKEEINNNVNAKVDFGDIGLSILSTFPDLKFSLSNLVIIGNGDFEKDTLANISELSLKLDIMSVIKGDKIKIEKIILDKPYINAIVLKNGKANWDIMKPSEDTTGKKDSSESNFKMALKQFKINDGIIKYRDDTLHFAMKMVNVNNSLKGDFTADNFILSTLTTINELSIIYENVPYVNKAKADISADMDVNMKEFKFEFTKAEAKINELLLSMAGYFSMPDTSINMDFELNSTKTDFKNILSMVPYIYANSFKDVQTRGNATLSAKVKGKYNAVEMPSFNIKLLVGNAMFKYPSLPAAVENININLNITNPDGVADNTVINIPLFHFEILKNPFDFKLISKTPVSNPSIDVVLTGKLNFNDIKKVLPLEKGTELNGILETDIKAKGDMKMIDKGRYEDFDLKGFFRLSDMRYFSKDIKMPLDIKEMVMTFNPKNVTLSSFVGTYGKQDFNVKGKIDNFIAYILRNETIKGSVDIRSKYININELMPTETNSESNKTSANDTSTLALIQLPDNIDFNIKAYIETLIYDNLNINDVKGSMQLRGGVLSMEGVNMKMLDGSLSMNGYYKALSKDKGETSLKLNIEQFNINKAFLAFNTVKKLAPIAEKCYGNVSCDLTMFSYLDNNMKPIMNSLAGSGKLLSKNIKIENLNTLDKIASALNSDRLKKLELKDINISFTFSDGRVLVEPFDVKAWGGKMTVSGYNAFDGKIDYTLNMSVPRKELGVKANDVINSMLGDIKKNGVDMKLGDMIDFKVLVSGTCNNPVVKTSLRESGENVKNEIKNKVKEEIDKKKKELETKAKEEINRAKEEAEKKAKEAAEKAKQQAEQKVKEETDRAKQEAEKKAKEAADKAKQEAKKKLKNLF